MGHALRYVSIPGLIGILLFYLESELHHLRDVSPGEDEGKERMRERGCGSELVPRRRQISPHLSGHPAHPKLPSPISPVWCFPQSLFLL